MKILSNYISLWKRDFTFKSLFISVPGTIVSYLNNEPVVFLISMMLIFTAFDCLGYFYLYRDYGHREDQPDTRKAAYRIMQFLFHTAKLTLIATLFDVRLMYIALGMHYLAVHDVLYYVFLKQTYEFSQYKDITWYNWLPVKWITSLFGIKLQWYHVFISAFIGLTAGIWLTIHYYGAF